MAASTDTEGIFHRALPQRKGHEQLALTEEVRQRIERCVGESHVRAQRQLPLSSRRKMAPADTPTGVEGAGKHIMKQYRQIVFARQDLGCTRHDRKERRIGRRLPHEARVHPRLMLQLPDLPANEIGTHCVGIRTGHAGARLRDHFGQLGDQLGTRRRPFDKTVGAISAASR